MQPLCSVAKDERGSRPNLSYDLYPKFGNAVTSTCVQNISKG
jgi:hypothetical protein